ASGDGAWGRRAMEWEKKGDMGAMRVGVAGLWPRGKEEPVAFELPPLDKPADSVAAAATIVAAVAAGEEAAELAKVIDVYVRAIETKGFDERLTKLEATTQQ